MARASNILARDQGGPLASDGALARVSRTWLGGGAASQTIPVSSRFGDPEGARGESTEGLIFSTQDR